nr:Ras-related protein RAB2BV-like [Tanacetum cinerariifolium]
FSLVLIDHYYLHGLWRTQREEMAYKVDHEYDYLFKIVLIGDSGVV